jgi:peptidoglycan/xylan/chitin deacetylase (PgdA/CDA1 family)
MYHRIVPTNSPVLQSTYNNAGITLPLEYFEKQLYWLHKNAHVLPLDRIIYLVSSKRQLPRNTYALTFDDGFKEHYDLVLPLLKKYNFSATFFIMGNPTFEEDPRWLDKYYFLIDNSTVDEFDFQWREFFIKGAKPQNRESLLPLKLLLRASSAMEQNEILAKLEKTLAVHSDWDELNRSLYISRENILEMSRAGMLFGAHTMTHSDLSKTKLEQAREEIVSSVKLTRQLVGSNFMPFAYPFGEEATYDKKIIEILIESNVTCACTSDVGTNSVDTPLFELKRIPGEHLDKYLK